MLPLESKVLTGSHPRCGSEHTDQEFSQFKRRKEQLHFLPSHNGFRAVPGLLWIEEQSGRIFSEIVFGNGHVEDLL
jgi:hypothetical protein